jgi:hypothetical protein
VILKDVSSAVMVAPTPSGTTYLLYLQDDALVAREFDERASEVRGGPECSSAISEESPILRSCLRSVSPQAVLWLIRPVEILLL